MVAQVCGNQCILTVWQVSNCSDCAVVNSSQPIWLNLVMFTKTWETNLCRNFMLIVVSQVDKLNAGENIPFSPWGHQLLQGLYVLLDLKMGHIQSSALPKAGYEGVRLMGQSSASSICISNVVLLRYGVKWWWEGGKISLLLGQAQEANWFRHTCKTLVLFSLLGQF